jgi:hypothetical protein
MLAFFLNDQIAQGKLSLASISLPQLAQVGQSPTPSSTPTFNLIVAAQRIEAATQTQVMALVFTRHAQETIIALTPTNTPTITLTPTRTLTPTPTRTPFPTSVPQPFYVPGNVEGVKFVAKMDGVHRFTYVSGAISCCDLSNPYFDGWKTGLNIYKNRDIAWSTQKGKNGYFGLLSADAGLGSGTGMNTIASAESVAKGTFKEFSLRQNEYLWFIYPDARNFYSDNNGGVMLSITIVDALP